MAIEDASVLESLLTDNGLVDRVDWKCPSRIWVWYWRQWSIGDIGSLELGSVVDRGAADGVGAWRGLDEEGVMSELEGWSEAVVGQFVGFSQRSGTLKGDVARVLTWTFDRQTDSLLKSDSLDRNHIED